MHRLTERIRIVQTSRKLGPLCKAILYGKHENKYSETISLIIFSQVALFIIIAKIGHGKSRSPE
jgi:hypothetical protein